LVSAIRDSIKHTIKKLQEQELDNKRRIEQLEMRLDMKVQDKVDGTIKERLDTLEGQLGANLDERVAAKVLCWCQARSAWCLAHLAAFLFCRCCPQLPALKEEVAKDLPSSGGGGWIIPFIILLLLFLGFAGFAVSKYKQFQKSHLL